MPLFSPMCEFYSNAYNNVQLKICRQCAIITASSVYNIGDNVYLTLETGIHIYIILCKGDILYNLYLYIHLYIVTITQGNENSHCIL